MQPQPVHVTRASQQVSAGLVPICLQKVSHYEIFPHEQVSVVYSREVYSSTKYVIQFGTGSIFRDQNYGKLIIYDTTHCHIVLCLFLYNSKRLFCC